MKQMTDAERLKYLKDKRKWLKSKGMDLRPNRLKELIDLMEQNSGKNVDENDRTD